MKCLPELPAEVPAVKTMKPIICIEQTQLLTHLQTLGEKPLAVWYNDTTKYPAMLLVNRDTGTVSVLEYPALGNVPDTPFENLACLVSEGVNFNLLDNNTNANYKIKFQKTP